MGSLEQFVAWTKLKIRLHIKEGHAPFFKERDIWWTSIGQNIGNEQDGKNETFERPVLIIKKFNHDIFWGLPLTTQDKKGVYCLSFQQHDRMCTVILSQLRLWSSKRLLRKMGVCPIKDFSDIRQAIQKLI